MEENERRLQEENAQLKQQLAEYETIFNASPIMFWYKDTNNRILRINKAAAELEGTTPDSMEGKRAEDLYPPEQSKAFYADDLEVLNHPDQPKLNILEPHTAPGTGETRWLHVGKVAVRDAAGEVNGLIAFAMDVTSEQDTLRALRDKEKQQADILSNTSSLVYINDLAGQFLYVNRAYEEIVHVNNEALVGKTPHNLFPAEIADEFLENNQKVLALGTAIEFEETVPKPDKKHIFISVKFPLKDTSGRTYAICGISTDITERKHNERALQRSEQRLMEAQQIGQIGSFEEHTETDLLWWSEQLYYLFGLKSSHFVPTKAAFFALLHPEDEAEYIAALEHALATEGALKKEYRAKHSSGEWRYFETTASARKAADRIYLSGTVQDVTARKRAEMELAELRNFLSNVVNSIGDAVIATNKESIVTLINPIAATLTGWTQENGVGKPLSDVFNIINAKTREPCENPVKKVLDSGKIVGLANHTLLLSKNGREYQIADSAAPIYNEHGEITGVVMVFRDVTEEYERLEALQENEAHLNMAQEISRLGSWSWDVRRQQITWSDMMYEIHGLDRSRPPKIADLRQRVVAKDLAVFDDAAQSMNNKLRKPMETFEYRVIKPDGNLCHINVKTNAIFDESGNLIKITGIDQDVTEQKKAEQALLEQTQFVDYLIEILPGIFYLYEIDEEGLTRLVRWNKNMENVLGYSAEELYGRRAISFYGEATQRKMYQFHSEQGASENQELAVEVSIQTKQGDELPYFFQTRSTRHQNRDIVFGLGLDISERLRSEQELVKEKQFTDDLIETLPGIFYLFEVEGNHSKLIRWNNNLKNILGYSEEELSQKEAMDFFAGDSKPKMQKIAWNMLAQIEQGHAADTASVALLVNKHGESVPYFLQARMLKDEDRLLFFGVGIDVTEQKESERRIIEQKRFADNLIETLPGIFYLYEIEETATKLVRWNNNLAEVSGFSDEELSGKHVLDFFNEENTKKVNSAVDTMLARGEVALEAEMLTKQGHDMPYYFSSRLLQYGGKNLFFGFGIDITERRQAEQKLLASEKQLEQKNLQLTSINDMLGQSEARFRELADMLPLFVCETDRAGVILYGSRKIQDFGYDQHDITAGLNITDLLASQEYDKPLENLLTLAQHGNAQSVQYEAQRKDGSTLPVLVYSTPIRNNDAELSGIRVAFADITNYKKQEEKILQQAYFDSLTELPNRRLTLDRLEQLIKKANRANDLVAVIFLDLDDFKKVNDTLGHETGDLLLIEVAKRLKETIRKHDTIGRLGGDEFILLLGNLHDAADAQPVADNVLQKFRVPFKLEGHELFVTTSFGIAIHPDNGETPSELLRKADTAMYHAKAQGRNTYRYYTDAMNKDVSRRFLIEEQLYGALARNELCLKYQPVIELDTARMIGMEALLRWENPTLGVMPPEEFIPIAEQTGLIVPIGRYVISEALTNLAQWQKKYDRAFKLAVNLSPRQFRDPELVQYIDDMLQQTGVTNKSLELEITEGVLMGGQSFIDKALADLSRLGVSIAMDDFGTGYSSLSYLRSYPFNILKIDKSFVNELEMESANRALVNATIAMAHGLGLKVVAEGVEKQEQADYLLAQGCDFAQGYFFDKPLSAQEISEISRFEPYIPAGG